MEDPFDFFLRFLITYGPSVYVLINMTLLMWLVQSTLYSSNIDTIPKSVYLIGSILGQYPINDIKVVINKSCPPHY